MADGYEVHVYLGGQLQEIRVLPDVPRVGEEMMATPPNSAISVPCEIDRVVWDFDPDNNPFTVTDE